MIDHANKHHRKAMGHSNIKQIKLQNNKKRTFYNLKSITLSERYNNYKYTYTLP